MTGGKSAAAAVVVCLILNAGAGTEDWAQSLQGLLTVKWGRGFSFDNTVPGLCTHSPHSPYANSLGNGYPNPFDPCTANNIK